MLYFPESFLDLDGRFRSVIPADMVPVLYLTAGGQRRCASCLNAVAAFLDPLRTEEGAWLVVDYELLYSGPEEECDQCHSLTPTLFGDSPDPPRHERGMDGLF